jgi:hypothetical protein
MALGRNGFMIISHPKNTGPKNSGSKFVLQGKLKKGKNIKAS